MRRVLFAATTGGTYSFNPELREVSITIPDPSDPVKKDTSNPNSMQRANKPSSKGTPSTLELLALGAGFILALLAGAGVPRP